MTSDGTGVGTAAYTWNAMGRMATMTPYGGATTTYVYDGDGQRVEDTESQSLYWYGADGKLVGETDGGDVNIQWIDFDGLRISKFNIGPAGPWGANFYDNADGSLLLETNGSGSPNCRANYYPFGEPVGADCQAYESFQYAGLYTNKSGESGDYSAAHRQFSDTYYRWLSPDPGGRKVVKLDNPQTWNLYAYVTDNPTTLNDPGGLCPPQFSKGQIPCNGGNGRAGASQWDPFELMNIPVRGMTWVPPSQTDVTIGGIETKSPISPGYWTGGPKVGNGLELFGGAAPEQLMTPSVILQANVFASTLAHNFASEFKQGGCVSTFLNASGNALIPFTPSLASAGEGGAFALGAMKFNAALEYAASRPNFIGGTGLIYPMKSSVFRSMLADAQSTAASGPVMSLDLALFQGVVVEGYEMATGGCH